MRRLIDVHEHAVLRRTVGIVAAEDLAAALTRGGWPTRVTELTLTVEKDGDGFYAAPNPEAYFAFYGGLAELYRQEYSQYLEDLGNAVGGQE